MSDTPEAPLSLKALIPETLNPEEAVPGEILAQLDLEMEEGSLPITWQDLERMWPTISELNTRERELDEKKNRLGDEVVKGAHILSGFVDSVRPKTYARATDGTGISNPNLPVVETTPSSLADFLLTRVGAAPIPPERLAPDLDHEYFRDLAGGNWDLVFASHRAAMFKMKHPGKKELAKIARRILTGELEPSDLVSSTASEILLELTGRGVLGGYSLPPGVAGKQLDREDEDGNGEFLIRIGAKLSKPKKKKALKRDTEWKGKLVRWWCVPPDGIPGKLPLCFWHDGAAAEYLQVNLNSYQAALGRRSYELIRPTKGYILEQINATGGELSGVRFRKGFCPRE